ncbi:hypothetical protein D9619_004994 [Psilocybe cf. subviscida]|uniref:Uncharacterized protein n=1 Tax=Psilocybe cf. subviscida TaxID=2480587 RepID=A0A8H5BQ78_9AGAR|nr:hypothetical protein D9619_004994 [Psilocybe cf. subviscida]
MPFQIDVAELSGLVVEAGFYGMYLTLFIVSTYIFAKRQMLKVATLNLPMTITAVCMILLATAQLAVDTANVFVAFLHRTREERIRFLSETGTKLFSAKHCILITQLLIGDSFVSYRCWVVWGRRIWIVILPVLLSLGSAVSGTYVMWVFAHHPSTTVKEQKSWVAAIFTLSLCANAVATSLLAFRIWQVDRRTRAVLGTSTSSLMPIVKILVESGAINAAYLFIYNVTLLSGSQALEFMAQVATPISGIIFSIVIIRVGLNTKGELDWTVDHRSTQINFAAGPKPKTGISAITDLEAGALSTIRTVEVNIQRSFSSGSGTDVDADIEMKDSLTKGREV